MRRIIITLLSIIIAVNAFAQNGRSIYNRYSEQKGVSAVYISPAMFKMIGNLPDLDLEGLDGAEINLSGVVKSLKGFYVLSASNRVVREQLSKDVYDLVNSGKYELLMEAKDDDDITRIYVVEQNNVVNSFVLINSEFDEIEFICIDGEIRLEDLNRILASAD